MIRHLIYILKSGDTAQELLDQAQTENVAAVRRSQVIESRYAQKKSSHTFQTPDLAKTPRDPGHQTPFFQDPLSITYATNVRERKPLGPWPGLGKLDFPGA